MHLRLSSYKYIQKFITWIDQFLSTNSWMWMWKCAYFVYNLFIHHNFLLKDIIIIFYYNLASIFHLGVFLIFINSPPSCIVSLCYKIQSSLKSLNVQYTYTTIVIFYSNLQQLFSTLYTLYVILYTIQYHWFSLAIIYRNFNFETRRACSSLLSLHFIEVHHFIAIFSNLRRLRPGSIVDKEASSILWF